MSDAVLLCAGYATRMGALTRDFPKALLPVGGVPILEDLVRQLEATGRFERLVIVANHRDLHHFEAWRDARAGAGAAIELIDDGTTHNDERLGAIGDLALAIERASLGGPLLVAAGDNLFRFDLEGYLADFDRQGRTMVLLDRETDRARLSRSGVAEIDERGRLVCLHEKPEEPPSELCCPPLYLLRDDALAQLAPFRAARPDADAPGHLIAWLAEHVEVRTHRMRGARLDVGNAESYAAAEGWLGAHPRHTATAG